MNTYTLYATAKESFCHQLDFIRDCATGSDMEYRQNEPQQIVSILTDPGELELE